MFPITQQQLEEALASRGVTHIIDATIRQTVSIANNLEQIAGEPVIHLEIGNPGLPAVQLGVKAEIEALESGIANKYPSIEGLPALKEAGKKFVKAFLNVDVPSKGVIPTVGSMQGSFTLMTLLKQRDPQKDTILFLNPGFPAQATQAKVIGLKQASFDIYNYRGEKMEAELESFLKQGNVTALIYGNPNNPAWTNLTDKELEIVGRLATKYDAIVLEDLAYLGMDFRTDFSHPNQAPFIPSVANYTDNYILMISGSKIFSYAGQRIAIVCMGEKVASRKFKALEDFYNAPTFLDAYVFGVLYAASSGTAHSAQYALAAMMEAAVRGELNFVEICKEYGHRGTLAKKAFLDNGFHIVYSMDGDSPIGDGFFFTAGYPGMDSETLQRELMRYGVAAISLPGTGSKQAGIRVCVSMLSDNDKFTLLNNRLKAFHNEHK
jgi:aspartate/methionine/tyrosine aminotransferase